MASIVGVRVKRRGDATAQAGRRGAWHVAVGLVNIAYIAGLLSACATGVTENRSVMLASEAAAPSASADDLLEVDCLLPGEIRRLGEQTVYVGRRRPVKTTAVDCKIRGGEYTSYDRANYDSARKTWLSEAEAGDSKAQNYLGEIYEKGLGSEPDYGTAAQWYRRAAEQGYVPAQINLGKLYESGRGVPRDMVQALYWYRQALGVAQLEPDPAPESQKKRRSFKSTETVRSGE